MNPTRKSTLPTVDEISVHDVTRHLARMGWVRHQESTDQEFVFQGPMDDAGDPIRIYLPVRNNAISRRNRVRNALEILGAVEKKGMDELLNLLISQGIDTHEKRIQASQGQQQRHIPLVLAVDVITHMRQMASFAACVEDFPAPHFDHISKASGDFLENCYFPHTFMGSFGFAMEVGLSPSAQTSLHAPGENYPFERRVMKRIALGLKTCATSFDKKDPGLLVDSFHTGLNGNMCELLSAFIRRLKGRDVVSSFSWSDDWKDKSLVDTDAIFISPESAPVLAEASRVLKAMKSTVPAHIIATIQSMAEDVHAGKFKESEFLNPQRTIVLMHEYEPARIRKILVSLDPNHHAEACDAYKDGFQIELDGELERKGNQLIMSSYRLFKVTKFKKSDVVDAIRKRKQRELPPDPPSWVTD